MAGKTYRLASVRNGYQAMNFALTLFTTCKPFEGPFTTIQRNALRSWKTLCPPCEVLVFGNEPGVQECCAELGFRHIPDVSRSEYGTPLLDDLFRQAERFARNMHLAYVNADIVLTRDLIFAASIAAEQFARFFLIARRWNVAILEDWDFEKQVWEARLREYARTHGKLEPPFGGADIFVYPRGTLGQLPPFAVGRTRWDSALIYHARKQGLAVIDATEMVTSVHQAHDYSHVAGTVVLPKGPEAVKNVQLLGGDEFIFTPLNATHLLTKSGVRRNRTCFPPYLARKLATLPALYRPFRPLSPLVRHAAPWWRRLRTIRPFRVLPQQHSESVRKPSRRSTQTIYVFVHLPKTGGTTFHSSYLPAALSKEEIFVLNGERGRNAGDLSTLIQLPQSERSKLKVIAGHNTFELKRYFDQAKFIVIFRDPVDRAISAYMHAKHHLPDSEGAGYLNDRRITLEEFVTNPPPAHLFGFGITESNAQLRALMQSSQRSVDSVSDKCINNLLEQFAYVGLTEQLDLFLFYLHVKVKDFPLVLYNNRLVRHERKNFTVSETQKALIEHVNQKDMMLYRMAKARFMRDIEEIWSEELEFKWLAFRAILSDFRYRTGNDQNKARKITLELTL